MIDLPYNRIISYGCSFTAGSELTDHEFLGMTSEELITYVKKHNITGPYELFRRLNTSSETIRAMIDLNATKGWPNFVANRFNKPLHNRAFPGTSLADATYRLLSDLHYSRIKHDDLVLVGVTSPLRWFQFLENGDTGSGVFGASWETVKFSNEFISQLESNWVNAYNMSYNYYKELVFLSQLSDRLNGQIKLCYIFGKNQFLKHVYASEMKDMNFSKFYDFCASMSLSNNDINPTSFTEISGNPKTDKKFKNHHVFGHPKVEIHEQYANLVIKKLEQLYSD